MTFEEVVKLANEGVKQNMDLLSYLNKHGLPDDSRVNSGSIGLFIVNSLHEFFDHAPHPGNDPDLEQLSNASSGIESAIEDLEAVRDVLEDEWNRRHSELEAKPKGKATAAKPKAKPTPKKSAKVKPKKP